MKGKHKVATLGAAAGAWQSTAGHPSCQLQAPVLRARGRAAGAGSSRRTSSECGTWDTHTKTVSAQYLHVTGRCTALPVLLRRRRQGTGPTGSSQDFRGPRTGGKELPRARARRKEARQSEGAWGQQGTQTLQECSVNVQERSGGSPGRRRSGNDSEALPQTEIQTETYFVQLQNPQGQKSQKDLKEKTTHTNNQVKEERLQGHPSRASATHVRPGTVRPAAEGRGVHQDTRSTCLLHAPGSGFSQGCEVCFGNCIVFMTLTRITPTTPVGGVAKTCIFT